MQRREERRKIDRNRRRERGVSYKYKPLPIYIYKQEKEGKKLNILNKNLRYFKRKIFRYLRIFFKISQDIFRYFRYFYIFLREKPLNIVKNLNCVFIYYI